MREILFRGKRKDNGEWIEGFYTKAKYYLDETAMHIIFPLDLTAFPYCEFTSYKEIIPETLGEYTGLTDTNGIKIFEGDIVSIGAYYPEDPTYQIKFGYHSVTASDPYDSGTAYGFYYVGGRHGYEEGLCEDDPKLFEVVGNIHDNPELLEVNYESDS